MSGKNHEHQRTWQQSRASQACAVQRSVTPYKWVTNHSGRAILTVPSSLVRNTSKRSQLRGLFLYLNKCEPSASVTNINMFISVFYPCSCAVVVFTDLSLENNLVNVQKSLVSSTSFSLLVVLNGDPVIGIAVGATLGIFFVLFIILLGFIIYWRRCVTDTAADIWFSNTNIVLNPLSYTCRLSRKEETDIQIHSMRWNFYFNKMIKQTPTLFLHSTLSCFLQT